ncbi:MAG: hypothetical protein JWP31_128, partial [Aeromicrobium sp.]|nr:hypothetical protein [Aeromicrobium sp.]
MIGGPPIVAPGMATTVQTLTRKQIDASARAAL